MKPAVGSRFALDLNDSSYNIQISQKRLPTFSLSKLESHAWLPVCKLQDKGRLRAPCPGLEPGRQLQCLRGDVKSQVPEQNAESKPDVCCLGRGLSLTDTDGYCRGHHIICYRIQCNALSKVRLRMVTLLQVYHVVDFQLQVLSMGWSSIPGP